MIPTTRLAATTKDDEGFIHTTYWDDTDRTIMTAWLESRIASGDIIGYWVR